MTDRTDPRRPNQQEPETPEDNPPGTLGEVAPEDPKDHLPGDDSAEPGIPVKDPSPDTTDPDEEIVDDPIYHDDLPEEEQDEPVPPT